MQTSASSWPAEEEKLAWWPPPRYQRKAAGRSAEVSVWKSSSGGGGRRRRRRMRKVGEFEERARGEKGKRLEEEKLHEQAASLRAYLYK